MISKLEPRQKPCINLLLMSLFHILEVECYAEHHGRIKEILNLHYKN